MVGGLETLKCFSKQIILTIRMKIIPNEVYMPFGIQKHFKIEKQL